MFSLYQGLEANQGQLFKCKALSPRVGVVYLKSLGLCVTLLLKLSRASKASSSARDTSRCHWVYGGWRSEWQDSFHDTSCLSKAGELRATSGAAKSNVRHTKIQRESLRAVPLQWPFTLEETALRSGQVDPKKLPQPGSHRGVHRDRPLVLAIINTASQVRLAWSNWHNGPVW